jgi:S-adenosyl-L-methionine hydrolase (adenosine-forming)
MIVLVTDFGLESPYVGQMKAVLLKAFSTVNIVDLFHNIPAFNVRIAATLLAAYFIDFPENSIFLCVVDPQVGSSVDPVVVYAHKRWFVGRNNGLFNVLIASDKQAKLWRLPVDPDKILSNSFHGRDLFAPFAAQLALNGLPDSLELLPRPKICNDLLDYPWTIYIDHYGNVMTGIRAKTLPQNAKLMIQSHQLIRARTFSECAVGQQFWYENANGLAEIAVNQGNSARILGLTVGLPVQILTV